MGTINDSDAIIFDAIIIGTGQAGPALAQRLSSAGMKTAVIERGRFGGTCVNTGCIPTKTMVASAYAAHMARRAAEFGVLIHGSIEVDMKQVKARKDKVSGASNSSVENWLKGMANCTVFEGHARFVSANEVRVGDKTLRAPKIFINVGGRAIVPDIAGVEGISYLTNSTMMDLDQLPQHLIIIGGSYISLEFGQMFRRFGSQVTILENSARVIAREDEDVSAAVHEALAAEGVDIRCNTKCVGLARQGNEVAAALDNGDELRGSHILFAIGRKPNTDDLGLPKAGINVDARGYITVDDQLRSNVPGVWALGDCNGKGAFTHTSYNDYEIVAANLLDNDDRRVSDRIQAYALYTDPPLGRAGMTEAEVRKSGRKALIGKRPMTRVARAVEKGETRGFIKVIVDAESKMILGAALLGTGCDEAIHSILDVMYAKQPYTLIQRAMHIHPTVSELIPTVLGELQPL